jgi:rRNA biogenesis protein RRP5
MKIGKRKLYLKIIFTIKFFAVAGNTLERGSVIRASVLDVSKIERLVDLSLKLEFVDKSK